ncbi:PC4-domain-containing protein [Coprinellus micaceus]|uniref:PC4-domain-containing protein n=1 Tax=Coprinellus micaceus TaxID=71717 RepID=A0A4Y7TW59_COPMI|nr:PC4-domain-containing protein [Coprinellus micaceus]
MGKRKVSESEEGSAEYTSDSDPKTKTKAKAKGKQKVIPSIKVFIAVQATVYMELNAYQKPTKKQLDSESESASESGSESEDEGPIAKKAKRERACKFSRARKGDKYVDLGKKKRATVRSFKETLLLDIREFYDQGGEEKPGKKGISLTLEQWKELKAAANTIDGLLSDLAAKKK